MLEEHHESRLRSERNVWLATVRKNGTPHLTPIWFVWLDGAFWLCTGSGSVKARNARTNPQVSVSLEDGDEPLVAEGSVTIHARPYPDPVVRVFASKFGWDITRPDADGPFDALLQVRVDRWLMKGTPG